MKLCFELIFNYFENLFENLKNLFGRRKLPCFEISYQEGKWWLWRVDCSSNCLWRKRPIPREEAVRLLREYFRRGMRMEDTAWLDQAIEAVERESDQGRG